MKKKYWLIAAIVIGVFLVVIITLPFVINVDQFRPTIQGRWNTALGRQVSIGHLGLSVWRGTLKAADVSIADDPAFSAAPFVRAKSLEVGIDLVPLIFSRTLHIRSITLRQPQLVLLRSSSGTWNFSSLGASGSKAQSAGPSGGPDFTVQKLRIIDGRMNIGSSSRRPQTYDGVNLTASNVSYLSSFPFSLQAHTPGGGRLDVEGNAGPINQRDASRTPFHAKLSLKKVDLASTGFLDTSSGIAGFVDYQGTVRSDGKVAHSEGAAKVNKLRLVKSGAPANQAVSFDYASDYDLVSQSGQLTRGELLTGKSIVTISGTYDLHGDSPVAHMKLNAPNIPVQDIEGLLPAIGVTLPAGSSIQGGAVNTRLSLDGALDRLVTAGEVNASNTRISGFGLSAKLAALSAFSGLKASRDTLIQSVNSKVRIGPEGIRADDIALIVADMGTVTGGGTISPANAMNFKMLAKLAGNGAMANLAKLGGSASGGIPFLIKGTTSNPVFLPEMGAMVSGNAENLVKRGANEPAKLGTMLGGLLGQKKK